MGKITFLVTKGETTYDMSELVESATWSGRKGSPARTLSVSLIDDDGWKHARSGIDVTKGNHCVFYWEGAELFRGIIMRQKQGTKKTMTIKAYDVGIYLSNNKDSFCYKQKKASEIFKDCCDRFQIPYKDVADTGYVSRSCQRPKRQPAMLFWTLEPHVQGHRHQALCDVSRRETELDKAERQHSAMGGGNRPEPYKLRLHLQHREGENPHKAAV